MRTRAEDGDPLGTQRGASREGRAPTHLCSGPPQTWLHAGTVPWAPVPSTVCTRVPGTFTVVLNCQPHHSSTSATSELLRMLVLPLRISGFFLVACLKMFVLTARHVGQVEGTLIPRDVPLCICLSVAPIPEALVCPVTSVLSCSPALDLLSFLPVLWMGVTISKLLTCRTRNRKSPFLSLPALPLSLE